MPKQSDSNLATDHLPGVAPLTWKGDLAAKMVGGISKWLLRETQSAAASRHTHWKRDLSSWAKHTRSVEPNRQHLARILGVVDHREPAEMRAVGVLQTEGSADPTVVACGSGYVVRAVRWSVLRGVEGEGLLLEPEGTALATIIVLPDCDMTPEAVAGLTPGLPEAAQTARRLAESGCRVLVPALIDRSDTYSCVSELATNQPHREFIYRAAYEMGRHVIGYEIHKVLAAVDWFCSAGGGAQSPAVVGYGEGGLLALNAAALDPRIAGAVVSGYFGPREELWREPIYRNVWSLLTEFGDAEIATLIAPRPLVVEACPVPDVSGPPPVREGRNGAAPGALKRPTPAAVASEVKRAQALLDGLEPAAPITFLRSETPAVSEAALTALLSGLGVSDGLAPLGEAPCNASLPDAEARLKRQFGQLVEHTQFVMREGEYTRREYWAKADATDVASWKRSTRRYRKLMWEEVIGAPPKPDMPLNPRARQVYATDAFIGYEVVLDVFPDVFAYGILLVPRDIQPGERRPVVVCQHGLEGRPSDVSDPDLIEPYYHNFACRLAERGFITFAPQNPYIGMDEFRLLQRLANPLKLSLFSFIIRQHERILEWLGALPYVDAKRMGFYGLSYGGKTAMRVPAIVEGYCLSICSGDFNEWIWKNASTRSPYSYMRTPEWEMFEFDLGNTFNYAEMSWLICPRPFMVERGHWDGVAPDEWVNYEYAKSRYRYDLLGIGDRTEIEHFNGPHEIHAVGTFEFLEKHLRGA